MRELFFKNMMITEQWMRECERNVQESEALIEKGKKSNIKLLELELLGVRLIMSELALEHASKIAVAARDLYFKYLELQDDVFVSVA